METEFEVRFVNIDRDKLYLKFKDLNAKLIKEKTLMKRQTFDFLPEEVPQGQKKWIRVRSEGGKTTLTLKHIIDKSKIDGVKEIEIIVDDFNKTCELLTSLGMIPGPYQENFRETWELDHCQLTIDEWPGLSPFIEVEGSSEEQVTSVCQKLGFDMTQGKFGSVDSIYSEVYGITPVDLNKILKLDFNNYKSVLIKSL